MTLLFEATVTKKRAAVFYRFKKKKKVLADFLASFLSRPYPGYYCGLLTVKGTSLSRKQKKHLKLPHPSVLSIPDQSRRILVLPTTTSEKASQDHKNHCFASKMLNLNDNSNRNSLQDPITLNVGGEIYTTTLDTLTRCRDSMLGAMFTGQIPVLRDNRGNVFIDRDGKVFRYILNYLRSSSLDLPDGFSELALLWREADFFQICPLLEEIRRYEASVPLSLRGGPLGAMIMINVDSKVRVLHFNLRHGPENYELRTCSVRALTVDLFCTWRAFLALLCERFSYRTSQGLTSPNPCNPRQNRLKLEWVPRPNELPQDQYDKQRYRGLTVSNPEVTQSDGFMTMHWSQCEITDMQGFVEELLKVSLAEGFKVDLVTPDPAEILNCTSLRLVKS